MPKTYCLAGRLGRHPSEWSVRVKQSPGCLQNRAFPDRGFGGRSVPLRGGCHYASPPHDLFLESEDAMGGWKKEGGGKLHE